MATYSIVQSAEVADKYLALVERFRANFAELYETGRWKHYYSETELLARVHELIILRDKWTEVAALGRKRLPTLQHWTPEPPSDAPANEAMRQRAA
jgi:hypothetical protein